MTVFDLIRYLRKEKIFKIYILKSFIKIYVIKNHFIKGKKNFKINYFQSNKIILFLEKNFKKHITSNRIKLGESNTQTLNLSSKIVLLKWLISFYLIRNFNIKVVKIFYSSNFNINSNKYIEL